jgi:hypothetical protein
MDQHDDDIQFDFFDDEPATAEAAPGRVRIPGRRSRGSSRSIGPPHGAAPLLRLLALVALVVVVVLVFALVIQSCASSSKHDAYANYMDDVNTIATQSTANGKQLFTILTTPGLTVTQIEAKLRGLGNQEAQNVRSAEQLDPPGRLRDEARSLTDSLQLRVNGLSGLADTFQRTAKSTKTSEDATLLAGQAERLVASDVVWDELFRQPAIAQLQHDGISGVQVPEAHYVTNPDQVTAHSMALVLGRIRGASTGGTPSGRHGTNLVSTKAMPSGQVLSSGSLNTVTATTALAFDVTVHDGGDAQEVQIPVTLTIDRPSAQGGPIVKTQTIQLIDPGQDVTVTFNNLGEVPFASQTTVKVDVAAVPGEVRKDNNSARYPVIFSLP